MNLLHKIVLTSLVFSTLLMANIVQKIELLGDENSVKQVYNKGLSNKKMNHILKPYKDRIVVLEKKLTRRISIEEKYLLLEKLTKERQILLVKKEEINRLNEFIRHSNSKVVKKATKIYEEKGFEAVLNYFQSKEFKVFTETTEKNMKEVAGGYLFQAKILQIDNQYDEAKKSYNQALRYERSTNNLLEYAIFIEGQNYIVEAIEIYTELLFEVKSLNMKDNNDLNYNIALVQNYLASLYQREKKLIKAQKLYEETLGIRRKMAENDFTKYGSSLLVTLNALGGCYREQQQVVKSKKVYEEALLVIRKLVKINPSQYSLELALTLGNLGLLDKQFRNFKKSIKRHNESLAILRKLNQGDEEKYKSYLAQSLLNLGNTYGPNRELKKAKKVLDEALSLERELIQKNPQKYMPDLANTLNSTSILYGNIKQLDKEKELFHESLKLYKILAKNNPKEYNLDLANALVYGVTYKLFGYKSKDSKLNEAKILLAKFKNDPKADRLLNKIYKLEQKQVMRIDTKDKNVDFYGVGQALFEVGMYAQAIPAFMKEIQKHPNNDNAYIYIGICYQNQKRYNKAIRMYKKAIKVNPKSDLAYYNIGYLYEVTKDITQAIKAYKKAVKLNLKDYKSYLALGRIYHTKGALKNATFYYNKVIRSQGKNQKGDKIGYMIEAYDNLGIIYAYQNQLTKAIEAYNSSISLNNNNEKNYIALGDIYYHLQDYSNAIKSYMNVIKLNENSEQAYFNLGNIFFIQKQYSKVIQMNKKVVQINPKHENAYLMLGTVYGIQQQYMESIKQYEKVLKINPQNEQAENILNVLKTELENNSLNMRNNKDIKIKAEKLNNQGEKLYHKKQYKQAIRYYKDAIKVNSMYSQAYSNLGLAYQKLNQDEDAIWANSKAIELASGKNKNQLIASSSYNIAKIYEKYSKWKEALKYYENALLHKEHKAYRKGIKRMKEKLNY